MPAIVLDYKQPHQQSTCWQRHQKRQPTGRSRCQIHKHDESNQRNDRAGDLAVGFGVIGFAELSAMACPPTRLILARVYSWRQRRDIII